MSLSLVYMYYCWKFKNSKIPDKKSCFLLAGGSVKKSILLDLLKSKRNSFASNYHTSDSLLTTIHVALSLSFSSLFLIRINVSQHHPSDHQLVEPLIWEKRGSFPKTHLETAFQNTIYPGRFQLAPLKVL